MCGTKRKPRFQVLQHDMRHYAQTTLQVYYSMMCGPMRKPPALQVLQHHVQTALQVLQHDVLQQYVQHKAQTTLQVLQHDVHCAATCANCASWTTT
jgi:hypothetical protein